MLKKIAMWNVNRKRDNDTPADTVQNDNNHDRDSSHEYDDCWFGSARFSLNFLEVKSTVFAFIFLHLLARKPNLEKCSIYSNKFHNFYLSESSFTCPGLWASGLG